MLTPRNHVSIEPFAALAGGEPVRAAGEVKILAGRAHEIDNWSGHYQPTGDSARDAAFEAFEKAGYKPNRYKDYTF